MQITLCADWKGEDYLMTPSHDPVSSTSWFMYTSSVRTETDRDREAEQFSVFLPWAPGLGVLC